ncbi:MAG: hypothetical protein ACOYMA_02525 [Bacteroidia bacterium]
MKNLFSIILLCFSVFVNAQTKETNIPEKFIGIQARLIDLMPLELSYLRIQKTGFSFAIRGGYGKGTKNKIIKFYSNSFYNSYSNDFSNIINFDQTFDAFFIKPGIIISKKYTPVFNSFYLINFSYAQSNDKLSITSQDQLFGTYTNEYRESHVYQSVEIEGYNQLKLTPKIYFGLGYILGYKIRNEIPFKDVIIGIETGSQYSPSQGIGNRVYINAEASLMYKL